MKVNELRIANVKTGYKWSVVTGDIYWLKYYPHISEDDNWFHTKEEALHWLLKQHELDNSFGDSECFILEEMFFLETKRKPINKITPTFSKSTDNLKEGDFITCKRVVGLTSKNECLTVGKSYQIINLWRDEDLSIRRIFLINNHGKKCSYDVRNSFYRNWSI